MKRFKKLLSLVLAFTMLLGLSSTAMAAKSLNPTIGDGLHDGMIVLSESVANETLASNYNPVFYSGKVYGYNSSTNYIALAGEATWNWGPVQPPSLEVIKEDYWWLSANDYNDWYFEYTWNSMDCTYVKIYDTQGEVYIESYVTPNTNYNITFFVQGLTSSVALRMDRIVDGISVYNIAIGGMEVLYN